MRLRHNYLLLDCDGVIVNSEQVARDVEVRALEQLGMSITAKEYQDLVVGHPESQALDALTRRAATSGLHITKNELGSYLRTERWNSYKSDLRLVPIMDRIIDENRGHLAVVSSSDFASVRSKLDMVGLASLSNNLIFTSEKTKAGTKTAAYTSAVTTLKIEPKSCVAIEDSLPGVRAATEAQIEVWGFLYSANKPQEMSSELIRAGATRTFADPAELRRAITEELG